MGGLSVGIIIVGTLFTCIYTVRLGWILVGESYKGSVIVGVEDNVRGYTTPIVILLIGAVIGGGVLMWLLFCDLI